jgi:nickel superoxide dismutase
VFRLIKPVYAHCDVPCGIYETDTMKHAAATCLRMIEKIEALPDTTSVEGRNSLIRMVTTKEKHAQKAKDEMYLLWSDYFKPEHLEKFPDLHTVFWNSVKQASKVKQTASKAECESLIEHVQKIADMFEQSKQ